jgi:hypothetical protein
MLAICHPLRRTFTNSNPDNPRSTASSSASHFGPNKRMIYCRQVEKATVSHVGNSAATSFNRSAYIPPKPAPAASVLLILSCSFHSNAPCRAKTELCQTYCTTGIIHDHLYALTGIKLPEIAAEFPTLLVLTPLRSMSKGAIMSILT